MFLLISLVWFKKLWVIFHRKAHSELEIIESSPNSKFFNILYRISTVFAENTLMRWIIFFIVMTLLFICSLGYIIAIHEMHDEDHDGHHDGHLDVHEIDLCEENNLEHIMNPWVSY